MCISHLTKKEALEIARRATEGKRIIGYNDPIVYKLEMDNKIDRGEYKEAGEFNINNNHLDDKFYKKFFKTDRPEGLKFLEKIRKEKAKNKLKNG